jgi:hypothetical protein
MPAATIFPDSGECAYSIEKKDEEDAIYSFLGEHFLQTKLDTDNYHHRKVSKIIINTYCSFHLLVKKQVERTLYVLLRNCHSL